MHGIGVATEFSVDPFLSGHRCLSPLRDQRDFHASRSTCVTYCLTLLPQIGKGTRIRLGPQLFVRRTVGHPLTKAGAVAVNLCFGDSWADWTLLLNTPTLNDGDKTFSCLSTDYFGGRCVLALGRGGQRHTHFGGLRQYDYNALVNCSRAAAASLALFSIMR